MNLYYVAPAMEFVECITEGILCESGVLENFNEIDLDLPDAI